MQKFLYYKIDIAPILLYLCSDKLYYEKFADGSIVCIEDEIPFEISDSWEWVRLGNVYGVIMGQSPDGNSVSKSKEGIEFHQGKVFFTDKYIGYSGQYTTKPTKIAETNSVLLCVRAPVGSVNIADRKICIGRGLCSVKSYIISPIFTFFLLQTLKNIFIQKATGTTFVAITVDIVKKQIIPLPPLVEQQHIVETVENLLQLVDKIEEDKVDLGELINQTKSKVLDLAIKGKLVPQDPNDEPADKLLERIREEKEKLIKEGKLKRDKNETYIFKNSDDNSYYEQIGGETVCIDDDLPFEIPDSWRWCRLRNIGQYKKGPFGSALTKSIFVPKSDNTIKVYEQKNAIQKDASLGSYYITNEYYESKMKSFTVFPGEIIVSCAGTIGETYILPSNIEKGIINQALMRISLTENMNVNYFLNYFDFILKREAIENSQGTAIKNIPPFDVLKEMYIVLPPIDEQNRIAKKIESIFTQLDQIQDIFLQ